MKKLRSVEEWEENISIKDVRKLSKHVFLEQLDYKNIKTHEVIFVSSSFDVKNNSPAVWITVCSKILKDHIKVDKIIAIDSINRTIDESTNDYNFNNMTLCYASIIKDKWFLDKIFDYNYKKLSRLSFI